MIERDFFCPKIRGILQSTPSKSINVTNIPRIITQAAKEPERFPWELVETKNGAQKRVNIGLVVRDIILNLWSCKSHPVLSFGPSLWLSRGLKMCQYIFCVPHSTIACSLFSVKDYVAASLTHMSRHAIQNSHQQTIPMCGCCFVLNQHQNACLFVRSQTTTLSAHFQCGPLQSTVPRRFLLTLPSRKWFQHRGLRLTLPSSPPSFTFIAARQLGSDCVLDPGVRMVSTFCSFDEV